MIQKCLHLTTAVTRCRIEIGLLHNVVWPFRNRMKTSYDCTLIIESCDSHLLQITFRDPPSVIVIEPIFCKNIDEAFKSAFNKTSNQTRSWHFLKRHQKKGGNCNRSLEKYTFHEFFDCCHFVEGMKQGMRAEVTENTERGGWEQGDEKKGKVERRERNQTNKIMFWTSMASSRNT